MTTYKFLAKGAVGPISGFRWPEPRGEAPGAWVETEGTLSFCVRGAHVCRPFDLAHWLHDELWETEAEGDQVEGFDCLVVRRARLVRRIEAWRGGGAARFAEVCGEHAAELSGLASESHRASVSAYIDDAFACARMGFTALAAFSAAVAVAKLADPDAEETAYRHERLWQAEWITRVLIAA